MVPRPQHEDGLVASKPGEPRKRPSRRRSKHSPRVASSGACLTWSGSSIGTCHSTTRLSARGSDTSGRHERVVARIAPRRPATGAGGAGADGSPRWLGLRRDNRSCSSGDPARVQRPEDGVSHLGALQRLDVGGAHAQRLHRCSRPPERMPARGHSDRHVDALIAQLCITNKRTLLTTDRDFQHAANHCKLDPWSLIRHS
jgi:hypothetical protein